MRKVVKGLPYSYSRRYRLTAKNEVQSVFAAKPKKVSCQYLLVLYTPNQLSYARLGIIAGKQYLRHAVDRNRVRRVIRESFRHARAMLKGFDLVVLIRSECSSVETKTLRSDIDHLLQAIQC